MTGRADSPGGVTAKTVHTRFELVVLDVRRIRAYERRPRRAPHPRYDRIKASICAEGLDQPLIVTRRPGETGYLVHAGGNTRLWILQELFDETGDRRFGDVPCVIRPWTREADVLLAHLRENDLRGELTFLDRALAVVDVGRFFEEGSGEALTHARLAERLHRCGYAVSQSLIAQMAYAVERLRPWLPLALEGGIGRTQVAEIRALDRAARAIWLERVVATEAEYDETFAALCRRYDAVDWDLANLRRALEAEIAAWAETSLHAVSLEMDHRMSGREVGCRTRRALSTGGEPISRDDRVGSHGRTPVRPGQEVEHDVVADRENDGSSATPAGPDPRQVGSGIDEREERRAGAAPGIPATADMQSARAQLWTLAHRLAQRHGLGDLVQPMRERGLGFVLQDVLDPRVHRLDPDALTKASVLPEESALRSAFVGGDAVLLLACVGTLHRGRMGDRFWCPLDDRDWQDVLSLINIYRALWSGG